MLWHNPDLQKTSIPIQINLVAKFLAGIENFMLPKLG